MASHCIFFQKEALAALLRDEFLQLHCGFSPSEFNDIIMVCVRANVQEAAAASDLELHQALLMALSYLRNVPEKCLALIFSVSTTSADDLLCKGVKWLSEGLTPTQGLLTVSDVHKLLKNIIDSRKFPVHQYDIFCN